MDGAPGRSRSDEQNAGILRSAQNDNSSTGDDASNVEIGAGSWVPELRQVSCYIAQTTPETLRLIRENAHRSPMYTGQISAIGPRYCPSIEDKIVRFPDKTQDRKSVV